VAFLAPANSLQLSNLHGLGAAGATAEAWAMQPVYVLSAGPDGEIETPFVNGIGGYPTDPYAYTPRGDDQVAMIKGSF
jgi:hypothetical protein